MSVHGQIQAPMMDLYLVLLLYVISLILVACSLYKCLRITLWSSINLSIIISLIILVSIHPPYELVDDDNLWLVITYIMIVLISPLVIIIYAFSKGIFDRRQ